MIRFESVSVTYQSNGVASLPVLQDVNLHIPEGELCLVIGETGSGKSTLLRCVNGLVPHFTGGTLSGRVRVAGRDTRTERPRDLADVVGVVTQDPDSGFVAETVEDELAFGMEWLGVTPHVMRRRMEETLDLLGLANARNRALTTLSGGQRQRVAIGAALMANPKVLVLDEPTSALDPQAAEDVLSTLQRLVHDLGTTVILAEHRLERVVQYADHVVCLSGKGQVAAGPPEEIMTTSAIAPPVVQLGKLAGWNPLPLSIRDARRSAVGLRKHLQELEPVVHTYEAHNTRTLAEARKLSVTYGPVVALRQVDFHAQAGEIVAVMGRNGSGKSTLLNALVGQVKPVSGTVTTGGVTPSQVSPAIRMGAVGLVPQNPTDILYADSVATECRDADSDAGKPTGTCSALLTTLAPDIDHSMHPRDLSEGQRLALALAIVLTAEPPLILLDEPTRGLDYGAKKRLSETLRTLAGQGHGVVFATHDVEMVADVATRVVIMADGDVVSDSPTDKALSGSPIFAPQIAKILAPTQFLTVDSVAAALDQPL